MMLKRLSTNADAANVDTQEPSSASTVFTTARSCADWRTAGSAAAADESLASQLPIVYHITNSAADMGLLKGVTEMHGRNGRQASPMQSFRSHLHVQGTHAHLGLRCMMPGLH